MATIVCVTPAISDWPQMLQRQHSSAHLAVFHPSKVLNSTTDTNRDVKVRRNNFARLSHLQQCSNRIP
jgi:hypothetical protein